MIRRNPNHLKKLIRLKEMSDTSEVETESIVSNDDRTLIEDFLANEIGIKLNELKLLIRMFKKTKVNQKEALMDQIRQLIGEDEDDIELMPVEKEQKTPITDVLAEDKKDDPLQIIGSNYNNCLTLKEEHGENEPESDIIEDIKTKERRRFKELHDKCSKKSGELFF
jgi:hypothetical protein